MDASFTSTDTVDEYIKKHENKSILRFITCGSVDDGKSTLIGRLLYDSKALFEDQIAQIKHANKRLTTNDLDFSLLLDGLQSEREQGITIDVAYRFFSTDKRKYIIADTPGHEQYTRNMATGASTADLALLLIDARNGITVQTRRHSYLVNLLRVKKVIIVINKMDIIEYSESSFNSICADYKAFAKKLGISEFIFIPISALSGDNVVSKSNNMPWYEGKSLIEYLDSVEIEDIKSGAFRFPVQYVNRAHDEFRGYAGTIEEGEVRVGDFVTIMPSLQQTRVASILLPKVKKDSKSTIRAKSPMAITLCFEDNIDVSRGDMVVHTTNLAQTASNLTVSLIWMNETPLMMGQSYIIKHATKSIKGKFVSLHHAIDINTNKKVAKKHLSLNEIGECRLELTSKIAFDPYNKIRATGSFIVIDCDSNTTLAAGMIKEKADKNFIQNIEYSNFEKEFNLLVRKHFPEWSCRSIDEILSLG